MALWRRGRDGRVGGWLGWPEVVGRGGNGGGGPANSGEAAQRCGARIGGARGGNGAAEGVFIGKIKPNLMG